MSRIRRAKPISQAQREAASTVPGHSQAPIDSYIDNRLEQILQGYDDPQHDLLDMLRDAYLYGLSDRELTIRELCDDE